MPVVAKRPAGRDIRGEENARASAQAGTDRRCVTKTQRKTGCVFRLIEIADRSARQTERCNARDTTFVGRAIIRNTLLRTDVLQSGIDLELVVQVIDYLAVDACAAFEP